MDSRPAHPPEREAAYHFVGIVVLLTLMVIISFNDLLSPPPNQLGRPLSTFKPALLLLFRDVSLASDRASAASRKITPNKRAL